jgi:hypothetical protein
MEEKKERKKLFDVNPFYVALKCVGTLQSIAAGVEFGTVPTRDLVYVQTSVTHDGNRVTGDG